MKDTNWLIVRIIKAMHMLRARCRLKEDNVLIAVQYSVIKLPSVAILLYYLKSGRWTQKFGKWSEFRKFTVDNKDHN